MTDKNQNGASANIPNTMMLRRTLLLLIVCGIVAFCVLGFRLVKLQLIDHDFYEAKAIGQQVRNTKVAANRGTIYDTNMKILAKSASVHDVIVCPAEIKDDEDAYKIAAGLSEILGVDYDKVFEMTKDRKSWYKVVARKVEPEISEQIRTYRNENEVSGIILEENSKRYYPYGSLASHVIGFVGLENNGQAGLEIAYNTALTGVDGRVVRAKNAVGTDMLFTNFEDYYDAMDGHSMVTTLDSSIQYYLEKHLSQAVQDYEVLNGAAAIAMDVDTGGILGMVSLGNFDLNDYQAVSPEVQAKIDETQDEAAKKTLLEEAQQLQWRNKALSDTYEPGSTFKIVTMAIALNEGVVSLDDHFYCSSAGIKVAGDEKPRYCWKAGGHGDQTLTQALQHSCNVALVEIGQRIGAEKFYQYCEAFGLLNLPDDENAYPTGKTGIDLEGESGSIWWKKKDFLNPNNKSQLAAASFGQTFNITPLQLVTAVSACTNGGYLMKPHVVKELLNSDGSSFSKTEPNIVRQVISGETSALMRTMIEKVVSEEEGTGKNARVPGYRIGGKTGTSTNTVVEAATGEKKYIVSFMGVAPMDDPKIAILVLLDCPGTTKVYVSGGRMGAPTVGKMFADILPHMGIEPVYSEAESKTIDRGVPNVTGLANAEAIERAGQEGFTYRIIGAGATVTKQIPAANSIVAAGSQIIFYCDAEPSATQETMPDLSNLSYSIAKARLGMFALYIRADGPITNPDAMLVSGQSVPAGTLIDHGTVIEVSVADNSNLGRY